MIRVAILGFWHVHAADYAAEALAHPGMEIVAAWDHDTARGRARAAELGVAFHETVLISASLAQVDHERLV